MEVLIKEEQKTTVSDFLEETQKNTGGLHLKDFLIKPVQRILKYPLLFKELQKQYSNNTKEFSLLKDVLKKIESVANLINEDKGNHDNIIKMQEVMKEVKKNYFYFY